MKDDITRTTLVTALHNLRYSRYGVALQELVVFGVHDLTKP